MHTEPYLWLKAFHLIAVISWMAGLLYLPRLFVYHCRTVPGSEASEMLKTMERRLLKLIMNPAMMATWILGLWLAIKIHAFDPQNGLWMHYKLLLVIILSALHGMMAKYRKAFARDERPKSERFFRILNEAPALLLIGIVLLVVVKPV